MEFQVALKGKRITIPRIGLDEKTVPKKSIEESDPDRAAMLKRMAAEGVARQQRKLRKNNG